MFECQRFDQKIWRNEFNNGKSRESEIQRSPCFSEVTSAKLHNKTEHFDLVDNKFGAIASIFVLIRISQFYNSAATKLAVSAMVFSVWKRADPVQSHTKVLDSFKILFRATQCKNPI